MKTLDAKKFANPEPNGVEVEYERQLWLIRFSPCGKFLAGCGFDGTVQRWSITEEAITPAAPLLGHDGWVQCLAFQPAGKMLFSADSWGRLSAWNYEDQDPKPVWTLPQAHNGWIRTLAVSPDGKTLVTGGNDRIVRLWSAQDGKLLKELPHPLRVFSATFHPTANELVTGDLEGKIRVWDLTQDKETRQIDASVLYSYDTAADKIQHCGGVRHLAFHPDGNLLLCSGQKEPGGGFATGKPCSIVFNYADGKVVREMEMGKPDEGFAYDAQFHPAGFVMAAACAFPGKGQVWFWQPEEEKAFFTSTKLQNSRSLSVHPDGERLALLHSLSPNGNGRQLKDGKYAGGSAKIRLLHFPEPKAK